MWASNGVCTHAMTWADGNTFSSRTDIEKGCTENEHKKIERYSAKVSHEPTLNGRSIT